MSIEHEHSLCSCHKKAYNFQAIQVLISQSTTELNTNSKWADGEFKCIKSRHFIQLHDSSLDASIKWEKKRIRHEIKSTRKTESKPNTNITFCQCADEWQKETRAERRSLAGDTAFTLLQTRWNFLKRWQKHINPTLPLSRVGVVFDYNYLINLTPFAAVLNLTKNEGENETKKEHELTWMQVCVRHIRK